MNRHRHIKFFQLLKEFREQNNIVSDFDEMIKLFAEKVDLPVTDLKHINVGRKPVSLFVARRLEEKLNKPEGWMDEGDKED